MIYTTLSKIREHSPCVDGWEKLLKHLGKTQADDEPLGFDVILESNGLDDALWCCCAASEYAKEWRLFAVFCARQVQHLMKYQRSIDALDVAERFANGLATNAELDAAWSAAWVVDRDAAWSASTAASTAATWSAAWDMDRAVAWAASTAASTAAAREIQKQEFLRVIKGVETN